MDQLDLALTAIAAVVIGIGVLSNAIKQSVLQEPLIAVIFGIAIGPVGFGWLDMAGWGDETAIMAEAARLTLAIGLMGIALRLRPESVGRLWRPVTVLLTAGMLGVWLMASGLVGWTLGLPIATALLIGAVVTPTDPVVASAIVTGSLAESRLPLHLRETISLESGANDGLAFGVVMLPIVFWGGATPAIMSAEGWLIWGFDILVVGIGVAAMLGVIIGYGAAKLLIFAERHGLIERTSLLGYSIAFSLLTLGASHLVNADSMISVFLAGLIFNLSARREDEHEEERIQEAVAKLLTLPMFVLFGIALPIEAWAALGWPLLWASVLIVVLRRLPVAILLYPVLRSNLTFADIAFTGWFGPIGVAAIYYATMAAKHVQDSNLWPIVSALILASIVAHGLTAAGLTRWYGRIAGPSIRAR